MRPPSPLSHSTGAKASYMPVPPAGSIRRILPRRNVGDFETEAAGEGQCRRMPDLTLYGWSRASALPNSAHHSRRIHQQCRPPAMPGWLTE